MFRYRPSGDRLGAGSYQAHPAAHRSDHESRNGRNRQTNQLFGCLDPEKGLMLMYWYPMTAEDVRPNREPATMPTRYLPRVE